MTRTKINRFSIPSGIAFILLSLAVNAQSIKDIDGNTYRTVTYGLQVWTVPNLNVTHFRNGDTIPQARSEEEWIKAAEAGQPAWCYQENDPVNGNRYGKLYNWFAISDQRGLAPEGWHIPTNADWRTLIKNLSGVDMAGSGLKSTSAVWKSKPGTNKIGFEGIPGGYRLANGKFTDLGRSCRWWSDSAPVEIQPSGKIYTIVLDDTSVEVKYMLSEKGAGYSVRCEKD